MKSFIRFLFATLAALACHFATGRAHGAALTLAIDQTTGNINHSFDLGNGMEIKIENGGQFTLESGAHFSLWGTDVTSLSGLRSAIGAGTGNGTVTTFSAGDLSPLFTTSEANITTTPALSFSLSTQAANRVFAGPTTGSDAAPTFRALVEADLPSHALSKLTQSGATSGQVPQWNGSAWVPATPGTGSGDVVGPSSATDNAIVRFDGTTGKLVQNSAATIADTTGNITAGQYNGAIISSNGIGLIDVGFGRLTLAVDGGQSTDHTINFKANAGDVNLYMSGNLTVSNNITLASDGTGTRSLNIGAGGTLGLNAYTSTAFVPQTTTVNGHALSSNVTVGAADIDITALTADASPVGGTDYVMTYDASAGANKKVLLSNLPSGTASSVTVGTTDISSGTSGRILYNNGTKLGEKTTTGTGSVVLSDDPTLTTLLTLPRAYFVNAAGSTTIENVNATNYATGELLFRSYYSPNVIALQSSAGGYSAATIRDESGNEFGAFGGGLTGCTAEFEHAVFMESSSASGTPVPLRFVQTTLSTPVIKMEINYTTGIALKDHTTLGGGASVSEWRMLEASANGTNYTGFKSPASLASNVVYTMPSSDAAGLLGSNGSGTLSWKVSGTDYAPATSGTSILKGNGSGGFTNATSGTDYAPATSGTSILKGNGSGGFTNATSGTDYAPATTMGTEVASTSGTSITFTGIPSTAKRIVLHFVGVSTSGTSGMLVRIGPSGGVETTGYTSNATTLSTAATTTHSTAGFIISGNGMGAASASSGKVVLDLEDGSDFTWTEMHTLTRDTTATYVGAGSKSAASAIDRVSITTVGGTDTFDAGAINISYQ